MATTPQRRQLTGTVVSDKMTKTVIVRIDRTVSHPKYDKRFKVSRRLAAAAEPSAVKVGDRVIIEETRPLSATKRWRVIKKL
jgi:small subunit ribosomal protein S17